MRFVMLILPKNFKNKLKNFLSKIPSIGNFSRKQNTSRISR